MVKKWIKIKNIYSRVDLKADEKKTFENKKIHSNNRKSQKKPFNTQKNSVKSGKSE